MKAAVAISQRPGRVTIQCSDAEWTAVVASDSDASVQYTITDPHLRYAACNCPMAVQQQTCKHQLAALLHVWPGQAAAKMMHSMLGSKLGRPQGCDPQADQPLRPLTDALEAAKAAGKLAMHADSAQQLEQAAPAAAPLSDACPCADEPGDVAAPDEDLAPASFCPEAADTEQLAPQPEDADAAAERQRERQRQRCINHFAERAGEIASYCAQPELLSTGALSTMCQELDLVAEKLRRARQAADADSIDAASAQVLPSFHRPAGQTTKRALDAMEVGRRRKQPKQTGDVPSTSAAVSAPLQPRTMPGKQGKSNVWKRHDSLAGVLADPCFADQPPRAKPAAQDENAAPHPAAADQVHSQSAHAPAARALLAQPLQPLHEAVNIAADVPEQPAAIPAAAPERSRRQTRQQPAKLKVGATEWEVDKLLQM